MVSFRFRSDIFRVHRNYLGLPGLELQGWGRTLAFCKSARAWAGGTSARGRPFQ